MCLTHKNHDSFKNELSTSYSSLDSLHFCYFYLYAHENIFCSQFYGLLLMAWKRTFSPHFFISLDLNFIQNRGTWKHSSLVFKYMFHCFHAALLNFMFTKNNFQHNFFMLLFEWHRFQFSIFNNTRSSCVLKRIYVLFFTQWQVRGSSESYKNYDKNKQSFKSLRNTIEIVINQNLISYTNKMRWKEKKINIKLINLFTTVCNA